MNNIHARRATAFVGAAVATLAVFVGTDMVAAQKGSSAVMAANAAGGPPAQVVVITGQRAPRS